MSSSSQNEIAEQKKKIVLLAKSLKDELKKTADLEKENNQMKEELILKNERIEKLKEEIIKIKNKKKKNIKNLVKGFFDGDEEEEEDEDDLQNKDEEEILKEKILTIENEKLKNQIYNLEREKEFISSKLNEYMNDYNNLKNKYTSLNEQLQNTIQDNQKCIQQFKQECQTKIQNIQEQNEKKMKDLKTEITNKNETLSTQGKSIDSLSELYKTFDVQKFDLEKQISFYKEQFEASQNENEKLKTELKESKIKIEELNLIQNDFIMKVESDCEEINSLNEQIKYFRNVIDDLTPVKKDYIFNGVIIQKDDKRCNVNVKGSFGKVPDKLWLVEDEKDEKTFSRTDIDELKIDKNNHLVLTVKNNKSIKKYFIEFDEKEIKSFIKLFKETLK